jgi:TonB family protein
MFTVTASFRGRVIDFRLMDEAPARVGDPPVRYRIGGAPGVCAPAALDDTGGAPADFTLLEARDGVLLLQVAPAMTGSVIEADGSRTPLAECVARDGSVFALPDWARAHVVCGEMTFEVAPAEAPPRVARPPLGRLRWVEQKYTLGTGLVMALVLLLATLVPPDAKALSGDRLGSDVRLIAFKTIPPEAPPPSMGRAGVAVAGGAPAPATAKRPSSLVRLIRRRTAAATAAPASTPGAGVDVSSAGVLPLLSADSGRPIAQLLGRHRLLDANDEDAAVLVGMQARTVAGAYVGGLDVNGTGAGPGGPGGPGGHDGMLGRPGLDTIGRGGTCAGCPGALYGRGRVGGLPGRGRLATPDVVVGAPVVRGSLDRDIVRRIVRRHVNEVRFCYEQALARSPALSGRVAVSFTIGGAGTVAAAMLASSTMGHPGVEACVVAAVRRWVFPQPAGGGLVIATYPFNFVSAGGAAP